MPIKKGAAKSLAKKTPSKKTPTGVLSRSFRLFSMAGRVAAKEVGVRILPGDVQKKIQKQFDARIQQARVIADGLSHLKGAAMKAGQLLSLDTSDFLPPEAVEILSRLQAQATPSKTEDMRAVLWLELGAKKVEHIHDFSDQPVASASIGQIHSGTINDRRVAIKIQYPGVAESIDSDLAILRKLAGAFITFAGKRFSLDETFAEIRNVLIQEVDYKNERANLERYRTSLERYRDSLERYRTPLNGSSGERGSRQDDASRRASDYIIPQTYAEFSTSRVLTMSFEDGTPIIEWARSPATRTEERAHVARLLLDLFCLEFCDWGLVQTDPNFANYLVRGQSDTVPTHSARTSSMPQLVCLDFGATLEYSHEFRRGYANLLKTLASNDTDVIFQGAVEFGLLDARESQEAREAFKEMIQVTMEPFHADRQPFQFSDPGYEKRTVEATRRFTRMLVYSPPPRKILFLHRKLGGIFRLVKRLDATIDLRSYWQKMTAME